MDVRSNDELRLPVRAASEARLFHVVGSGVQKLAFQDCPAFNLEAQPDEEAGHHVKIRDRDADVIEVPREATWDAPSCVRPCESGSVCRCGGTSGFHHEPYPSGGTVAPDTGPMMRDPQFQRRLGPWRLVWSGPRVQLPGVTRPGIPGHPRVSRRRVPT